MSIVNSNTSILIKRSSITQTPSSLKSGELGFSYVSNNIFIGTSDGSGAIAIGGTATFDAVNQATSSNTASTLVKRDLNGAFSGRLFGTADKAVKLDTPEYFSISGGDITASAISFDGTANVSLNATLNTIDGLTSGTYGSTTEVPIITVAANGRVTSISSQAVTNSFLFEGDVGTATIAGGDAVVFAGANGITTTVSADRVKFSTDDTVLRSNTSLGGGHTQSIDTDLRITGNLFVNGTTTQVNSTSVNIEDPIIYLASNNTTSDVIDIGFVGAYGTASQHTGITRHAGDGKFYVFDGYTPDAAGLNIVDPTHSSFHVASLVANLTGGTVSNLTQAINVIDGGTGTSSFAAGELLVGNGQGALQSLANSSYVESGTKATNATLTNISVDTYGRVTGTTFSDISGLTVTQGGTGTTAFTTGKIVVGNGTGALSSLDNVAFNLTGTLGTSDTITSLSVDTYGRVTAATAEAIAIDADQITSGVLPFARGGTNQTSYTTGGMVISDGTRLTSLANTTFNVTGTSGTNSTLTSLTVDNYGRTTAATYQSISGLTVAQGGTGLSTITKNGVTFGNGTDGLNVTDAAGYADVNGSFQILTVTAAGTPVWTTTLDGGMF